MMMAGIVQAPGFRIGSVTAISGGTGFQLQSFYDPLFPFDGCRPEMAIHERRRADKIPPGQSQSL